MIGSGGGSRHCCPTTREACRGLMIAVSSAASSVLRSGCRWKDAPAAYGPHKTLYNRFVRWAAKGVWTELFHVLAGAGGPPAEVLLDSTSMKVHRCATGGKRGQRSQAIGVSRGGRNTKLHALSDEFGRLLAFALTGGPAADCRAAELLLHLVPTGVLVLADRGYDTNAVRSAIEAQGATPNIPPKSSRRWKPCLSRVLYRGRNTIERMFGRLKDFRRIATRYDKLAANFLGFIKLASIMLWLK